VDSVAPPPADIHARKAIATFSRQAPAGRRLINTVPRRPAHPSGFTLLEIIVVMTLIALFLYLSFTGYTRFIEATAIDGSTQMVSDALTEARQDAVTHNCMVEVRLYAAPAGNACNVLQLRWKNADGTTPPAAPAVFLPTAAVIDATPVHSSLVTTNVQTPLPDATDPRLNAQTRCFHFLPDGSTDLAATGKWMLTLRVASQSNPANFPANWACVEVDPVTGRVQVYRP
jgi:uncharacterized protein (TIGR02596 family)